MALGVCLLTDMNQIFQMRYCYLKRLQKISKVKLEVEKNVRSTDPRCISVESGRVGIFLSTYKGKQYHLL